MIAKATYAYNGISNQQRRKEKAQVRMAKTVRYKGLAARTKVVRCDNKSIVSYNTRAHVIYS